MSTDRSFDVITADPIHPWFRGAGVSVFERVFRVGRGAASAGGVVAQWLPIYELTPRISLGRQDVSAALRAHAGVAHPLRRRHRGSNSKFVIDEADLDRRMASGCCRGSEKGQHGIGGRSPELFVMGTEE